MIEWDTSNDLDEVDELLLTKHRRCVGTRPLGGESRYGGCVPQLEPSAAPIHRGEFAC